MSLIISIFIALVVVVPAAFFSFKKLREVYPDTTAVSIAIVVGILSIIAGVGAEVLMIDSLTRDVEYLSGPIQSVEFYEEWNEEVEYECNCRTTGSGSSARTSCSTCTRIDYHPPYWVAIIESHELIISQSDYDRISEQYGTEPIFTELYRHYHTIDGDKYHYQWNGSTSAMVSGTFRSSYTNRVMQADESVFNFREMSPEEIAQNLLIDYPSSSAPDLYPSVLYHNANLPAIPEWFSALNDSVNDVNAVYGPRKQIHVFILLYKNRSPEICQLQRNYWQGGNKNELNICIGIDSSNQIEWASVFSWTPNTIIHLNIEQYLQDRIGSSIESVEFENFLRNEIRENWVRREFEEFQYISVKVPVLFAFVPGFIALAFFTITLIAIHYENRHRGLYSRNRRRFSRF